MKRDFRFSVIVFLSVIALGLAGCGRTERWAYNHDPDTEILSLSGNGKAVFNGERYSYEKTDEFIILTGNGDDIRMRYVMDGDEMLLYQKAEYEYAGEGERNGIIGVWKQVDGNWSYEFTEKGTFNEDSYSPGYYDLSEEDGTIRLMYNDHYADTIIYYELDGDRLTVDYPWRLVMMK